jgi:hypothetical protein
MPYDIMVGLWAKQSIMYDPKGNYIGSVPGLVAVYWHKPGKLIHFREDLLTETSDAKKFAARSSDIFKFIRSEFDLKVNGKHAEGGSPQLKVVGLEARPDVYHFHLKSDQGHWYNNHHCITPNERHIMGPLVSIKQDGALQSIVAQTLTRISYDVPNKSKHSLK